jgi:hypothetical protein
MQQQVNLRKYIALPVKSPLDITRLLSLFGILAAFLLVIYLCGNLLKHSQLSELNNLKNTLDETRKNLVFTAAKFPQSQISIKLLDSSRLPSCNIKFSKYLRDFANTIIPGAWITDIQITNNGKQFVLEGHVLQANQAQQYLMQLKQLPEFANYEFEITQLTRVSDLIDTSKSDNSSLNFQLTAKSGNMS